MSGNRRLYVLALLVGCWQPDASEATQRSDDTITIIHPKRPHDAVLMRSASCGRNRFSITIVAARSTGPEKIGSVRVNGAELAAGEKRKVRAALRPGTFIIDAYISECSRTKSPSARLQLRVIHEPWRGNKEQLLEFWVGADRKVFGVKLM
jgi:hypothetical protein